MRFSKNQLEANREICRDLIHNPKFHAENFPQKRHQKPGNWNFLTQSMTRKSILFPQKPHQSLVNLGDND